MSYGEALEIQCGIASERKQGRGIDHLLFVEHPHVITVGRNGHQENLLAPEETLRGAGIELYESDRGGDVTYHGPGQIVAYPIMDLREWKRDVGAFVRAIEQVLIDTVADFGIEAGRVAGFTGVWVAQAICRPVGFGKSGLSEFTSAQLGIDPRLGVECCDGSSIISSTSCLVVLPNQ